MLTPGKPWPEEGRILDNAEFKCPTFHEVVSWVNREPNKCAVCQDLVSDIVHVKYKAELKQLTLHIGTIPSRFTKTAIAPIPPLKLFAKFRSIIELRSVWG